MQYNVRLIMRNIIKYTLDKTLPLKRNINNKYKYKDVDTY